MILKEFNYYLKKGTTLEEIQGSLIKKVNRWCDPFTGCVAHVFDTVLLKHWIVASDNVVGLYKLDKNILLFNDFQMIYDRLDKIEKALPKDDVKEDIIDRLDKVEENLSNIQSDINDKKDELSHQEKLKEQLEQEISTLDKKIEEAKARGEDTTELEKQKEEKEKELANVTKNITNITNEITKLEQTINNLLGQKDSIEKELEEHKPKEMAEKEYVDKRDNYILGQIESLIPKDPNRDSKKEEIKNTDNSIVSKEEELDNKEKEIDSQKELAKSLSDEIARLKDEIRRAKERGEDTTALEKELASKEQQLANTNSNISNLEKEKDKIKKELANLKGLKEELEKELDNIKPPEMVTIATNQTITGSKTFSKATTFNETIRSKGANTFSGANTFTENTTFNKGQVTFNNKAPICSVTPTAANHLTTKDYVDRINTNLTQTINTKDSANVKLTGNQTIAGNKTLSGATTLAATIINGATQLKGVVTATGAIISSGNVTFNTGQVTFNNKAPICSIAPTVANHLVNKAYVDGINTTLTRSINTKANANATVNLTGNQTIEGVKTFSSIPVSATQPTNVNQVANKAYVDVIAKTKAGFVTKTLTIGAGGNLANLSEFKSYAIRNFAHYYILSLVSDIEETEALSFNGVSFGFNTSNYTITFKKNVNFSYGNFYFGKIGLKIDTQLDESIVFRNCSLAINGDLTFTDTFNSSASLSTAKLGGISLVNTNAYFGDSDTWNITTAKRHFIAILGSRIQVGNVTFNGNLASGKELFHFARQGILMTQNSTFDNLTVTGIAQNAISNKGIWIKE